MFDTNYFDNSKVRQLKCLVFQRKKFIEIIMSD
jgi:hypothetical protein